jgi:CMP-2-keto-3-deoxyoctulosonic acid synthetase
MASTLLPDRPLRRTRGAVEVLHAISRLRLAIGRIVAWFAADPQRVQAAVTGAVVCVLTGCVVGVGAGLAAESLVLAVLGMVQGP